MDSSRIDKPRMARLISESAELIRGLGRQVDALAAVADAMVGVLRGGGKVLTAGNGGSAAEALHMSEELVGRFRGNRPSLAAVCLAADPTALTCIGNDFGFDEIFSRQVEGLGREGDMLVVFSTSGKAANLVGAVRAARAGGLKSVALLGRDGGPLKGACDYEIVVTGTETERIQEAHQVILHLLLDAIEAEFAENNE